MGSATQDTRTGLTLVDKQVYYITAYAINGAGLAGPEGSSDGIIVDATPPTTPVVTDDGQYTSNASSLHATWSATDPESGIAGYQYAIGSTAGGSDILAWTSAGLNTSVTASNLTLQTGKTYYVGVKALNGGGIYSQVGSSDGITVDTTPPSVPVVLDDGQYISDPHSIHASWSATDGESGISKYEYCVGTTAGGAQILGWTNAGTNTQAGISGLNLTNGTTYFVNVRATNGALLVSAVGSSDGATLDVTPPSTPVVIDDGDWTSSTTQLHASWSSSDPVSGIKSYEYAIGTTPGATDVVAWTDAGTNTSVTNSALSLVQDQMYYFSVIAVNGASAQSAAGSSDGIRVDATPPLQPVVTDDGQFTADNTQLHAAWTSSDPESGISKFEYSIGTSAGATDVVPWTGAGLSNSITQTGLSLQDGAEYYINVRAYNNASLVSAVGSSNGITVDLDTPGAPTVNDDGAYTASASSLHATWSSVTSLSGISSYEYSIGTSAGAVDVKNWTSVGLSNQVTATALSLYTGTTYFINVRARNSLNKAGNVGSSDGITVDLTPPSVPAVTGSGAWTSSTNQLTASWTSSDPESGIAQYTYAVGTSPGGASVLNWTSAGTQTSATITPLSLVDGGKYFISVIAINGAGESSPYGASGAITVDATPPTTPVVVDDGKYTVDPTKLHATWSSTDPQSGIVEYDYSVGTSAGATDVVGWTNAGTQTDKTITGLALAAGTQYFINVRATNGAGSVSNVGSSGGIIVDSTPPTTPVVTDEGAYTKNTDVLSASWTSSDPETGIADYQYSIGTAAGLTDVLGWTDAMLNTSVVRQGLSLAQGQTYFINVKATNGVGLVSAVGSSDGITVDTTPPGPMTIVDDGPFTDNTTQLHVVMQCSDLESGIALYEYAVGTSSGAVDVVGWTGAGSNGDITITALSLKSGLKYYVSGRATNGAGLVGPPGTSGAITVDTTPPLVTTVQVDGAYTSVSTSLHAKWSATDPISGIADYKYCIGTSPGANDTADWLDAGTATDQTRNGLSLVTGKTYYVTVIAVNNAGDQSLPVSSDGIKLDATPPSTPVVTTTGKYWCYKTCISATWTASDPESGIAEYDMSVGTAAGATDVADWLSVGDNTTYTRTGLTLKDGVTYFINVQATNGAGLLGNVGSSNGIMVDSTPPTTPVVTDDGDTTSVLDRLHATWLSTDPESGIAEYMYCIGTSSGATDVVGWTSAGTNEGVTVTGLTLDPVLRYHFSVKAQNNAGAWSAVGASDGIGYSSGSAIWWKFRNDSANVGRGLFDATRVNNVGWTIPTDGYVESSPAIATDGTSYIGSGDGNIYAITQNGSISWTYDTGASIDSSPAIAPNGNIIIGCNDGQLVCLSMEGTSSGHTKPRT